jgi:hypothetical protein
MPVGYQTAVNIVHNPSSNVQGSSSNSRATATLVDNRFPHSGTRKISSGLFKFTTLNNMFQDTKSLKVNDRLVASIVWIWHSWDIARSTKQAHCIDGKLILQVLYSTPEIKSVYHIVRAKIKPQPPLRSSTPRKIRLIGDADLRNPTETLYASQLTSLLVHQQWNHFSDISKYLKGADEENELRWPVFLLLPS